VAILVNVAGVGDLEFPDGTEESVIQQTVSNITAQNAVSAPPPIEIPSPAPSQQTIQATPSFDIPEGETPLTVGLGATEVGTAEELQNLIRRRGEKKVEVVPPRPAMEQLKDIDFGRAMKSFKGELAGLKDVAKLVPGLAGMAIKSKFGTADEKLEIGRQLSQGLANLPGALKESVVDTGKTFGVDLASPNNKVALATAIEKFESAPLQSSLDAVFLGAATKPVGKSLFKTTSRQVSKSQKKVAQEIFGKADPETEALAKFVADKDVNTLLDDLYDEAPIIKEMDIGSQLDSTNFIEKKGKDVVDKIRIFNKTDSIKLKKAVDKVKDNPVNMANLAEDVKDKLNEKGFILKTGELDVENIDKGLTKGHLIREIERIQDPKPFTIGELKTRMDNLDNRINWKNPKEADSGLVEIRRVYRNELRNASGEYDEIAKRISEKLDKFEPQLKQFEKVGAGEKFGKRTFQTREEMDEFMDLLNRSKSPFAKGIVGELKGMRAWDAWNKYFKQNPDFVIGNIPVVSEKLLPSIKKRLIKTDINIRSPRPTNLFRSRKTKPVSLGVRGGLEAKDIANELKNNEGGQ
jgi:hypothetical protein